MTNPAFTQVTFRGRNDNGGEGSGGATWKDIQGNDWTQTTDVNFRVRFRIDETNSRAWTNVTWNLYYQLNGGGYNICSGSTPVKFVTSSYFIDGDDCTAQLTGGTGTFVTDNNGMIESQGCLNSGSAGYLFEMECCLQIDSAQVADNDTVNLRIYNGTSPIALYSDTPVITVDEPINVSLTVSGGSSTHNEGAVLLTQVHSLTVNSSAQSNSADNVVTTKQSALTVAGESHTHIADNVVVQEQAASINLTVAGGSHSHSADNVVLSIPGQYSRPSADVTDGSWTNELGTSTNLYDSVNEISPDDNDYDQSEFSPVDSPVVLKLDSLSDPTVHTGHVLSIRYSKQPSDADENIQGVFELRQGYVSEASQGTLIATRTDSNASTTMATVSWTLTAGEAGSISDYTDLYIRIVANVVVGPTNLGVDSDWTQDGFDAQRTSYSPNSLAGSGWSWDWAWNGPAADNSGNDERIYTAPRSARAVTGGAYLFCPAGSSGLYAVRKDDGTQQWLFDDATVNATPAFDPDTGWLYIPGADGYVYKVNSDDGTWTQRFQAHSAVNRSLLLANSALYVVTSDGYLHKVNKSTMAQVWAYSIAGSDSTTPATYSSDGVGCLIFCTADLYVHCVDDDDGSQRWHVKPTSLSVALHNSFEGYWPVVAESHGVVFVRLTRSDINEVVYSGAGANSCWQANADNITNLTNNTARQNLFAMDLTDGSAAFLPGVGPGGVESDEYTTTYILSAPPPIVKTVDGDEVVYCHWRNGGASGNGATDARWDGNLGEMVLDGTTISGFSAGYMRFIRMGNGDQKSYIHIIDEQCPLTMFGNTILHSHWGALEGVVINATDRANDGKGLTYSDPIAAIATLPLVRRVQNLFTPNHSTHYESVDVSLVLYDDTRAWTTPAFFGYFDCIDPPTPTGRAQYSDGLRPRYAFYVGSQLFVQGNGGDIISLSAPAGLLVQDGAHGH